MFIFEAYLDKMCIIRYTDSLYVCLCAVHCRPMYCHSALAELHTVRVMTEHGKDTRIENSKRKKYLYNINQQNEPFLN